MVKDGIRTSFYDNFVYDAAISVGTIITLIF